MDQTAPADRPKTDSAPALDRKAEIVLWFLLAVMGQWLFAVHTVPWCASSTVVSPMLWFIRRWPTVQSRAKRACRPELSTPAHDRSLFHARERSPAFGAEVTGGLAAFGDARRASFR
jgi:hypothetical protein